MCGKHFRVEDYLRNPSVMQSVNWQNRYNRLNQEVLPSVFSKKRTLQNSLLSERWSDIVLSYTANDSAIPPALRSPGDRLLHPSGILTKRRRNALTSLKVNTHNYGRLGARGPDDVAGKSRARWISRDARRSSMADFEALTRIEYLERKIQP